jgi:hypothetical protein
MEGDQNDLAFGDGAGASYPTGGEPFATTTATDGASGSAPESEVPSSGGAVAPLSGVVPGVHVEEDDGPEVPSNDDTEKAGARAAAEPFDRTEMIDEGDGPSDESGSGTTEHRGPPVLNMTLAEVREATRRLRGDTSRLRGEDDEERRGPNAPAGKMLYALKVARKAAPRKEDDEPSVAFIVVASDPELSRILFSARDGRRWHTTFVRTSAPVSRSRRSS